MRIARVFPRRTSATPKDGLVFIDEGPGFLPPAVDEVHVSVLFKWDLKRSEFLARQWEDVAPVKLGGPAWGSVGEDFVPGRYVAQPYVITSRGCPNRCWFCDVWKREGGIRELPITQGTNVLDDNLLACSRKHTQAVFDMLAGQKVQGGKIQFTGGFEAARLEQWHVEELWKLRPRQMFFAYDTQGDLEPLQRAGEMLHAQGWTRRAHRLRAYVLMGYPKDTMDQAERRLHQTAQAGFMPMGMVWRSGEGKADPEWTRFQRAWARPAIMSKLMSQYA